MFFGPKRSPRRPVMRSGTAYARRYALVTHTTRSRLFDPGSNAALIAGLATETIVVSTRIMKNPMTIAQRAGHGLLGRCPLAYVPVDGPVDADGVPAASRSPAVESMG